MSTAILVEVWPGFISMIETSDTKKRTVTPGLEIMETQANEVKLLHMLVLLIFCIELEKELELKQYSWELFTREA